MIARHMGFAYQPVTQVAMLPIQELLERILEQIKLLIAQKLRIIVNTPNFEEIQETIWDTKEERR